MIQQLRAEVETYVQSLLDGQLLRRLHQCVFGVLALESEAVDPRL
ncbi:hypothetical protein [Hymenobacter terrenus]|nr:hypothetical protein [Hymenobacter terrenus]